MCMLVKRNLLFTEIFNFYFRKSNFLKIYFSSFTTEIKNKNIKKFNENHAPVLKIYGRVSTLSNFNNVNVIKYIHPDGDICVRMCGFPFQMMAIHYFRASS